MTNLNNLLNTQSNDYQKDADIFFQKTGTDLVSGHPSSKISIVKGCSVIIPFYKNLRFLEATINFLINQNFPLNFPRSKIEIILVDDGSQSRIEKIVKKISNVYPLTHMRLKRNLGRGAARNIGLLYAKKELVIFLDSDILVPNDFLFTHIIAQEYTKGCVIAGFREHISWNHISRKVHLGQKIFRKIPNYKLDFRYSKFIPQAWNFFYNNIPKSNFNKKWHILNTSKNFRNFGKGKVYGVWTLPFMALPFNMSIKRKYVIEVGGFDMRFKGWGMEDVHFAAKLIAYGLKIVPNLNVTGYHLTNNRHRIVAGKKEQEFQQNLLLYEKLKHESFITLPSQKWKTQMYMLFKDKYEVIFFS